MANKHPYVNAPGYIVQVLTHLRGSFPTKVTAETLKKLGFAPKNESYVMNVLRFLHLIDEEGNKTEAASKIFSQHDDSAFSKQFSEVVKSSYQDLYELHGEKTWSLDSNSLITFFRSNDHTSAIVGKHQATTFQLLAAFAGHGEMPEPKNPQSKKAKSNKENDKVQRQPKPKSPLVVPTQPPQQSNQKSKDFGLTVRVEINLPADGDQATYDRIFKSIRENLLSE